MWGKFDVYAAGAKSILLWWCAGCGTPASWYAAWSGGNCCCGGGRGGGWWFVEAAVRAAQFVKRKEKLLLRDFAIFSKVDKLCSIHVDQTATAQPGQ